MGRLRRNSKVLDTAQLRVASIKSIDAALDLGHGLTAAAYETAIAMLQSRLAEYNQALATVDDKYNALIASEKELGDLSERMLAGVAVRYGKDSTQYEMAGGVRKSERKPRTRKTQTSPTNA